jgi:YVTN family beta-propeller protein
VDAATRTITKMLDVGNNPGGILIVPDGSRAYVALAGDNAIAVIDLHTLEVSGKIPTGQGPDGLAWAARQ